jgi:hypothetical protein
MEGNIAGIVPGVMAIGLVGENLGNMKRKGKKKKNMVQMGMTNMVGMGMIGATAGMVPK